MKNNKKKPKPKPEIPEYWNGWLVEKGVIQEGPYKGWSAGLAALDYHNKEKTNENLSIWPDNKRSGL